MATQDAFDRNVLRISFGPVTQYTLQPALPHYPWTEVTVIDEGSKPLISFDGTPVASKHEGSHTVYRGYMEQFASEGGARIHALRQVALKWVVGASNLGGMKREARLYEKELAPLQGTVVPRFFGFFRGFIGDVEVGCIILEWCGGEPIWETQELK